VDGSFASLVRRARHAAWMTQEQLAERSGLSPRTIQAIERGKVRRPHRESVRLLADALGLSGTDRAEFEAAARGTRHASEDHAGCRERPCRALSDLAGCLACHLRHVGGARPVDLRGLGSTADPETVLARLLRSLGGDRDVYGMAGSLVSNHTLPVQLLPGA
jgi:transcriptional regulator with XRE-family HTH domain